MKILFELVALCSLLKIRGFHSALYAREDEIFLEIQYSLLPVSCSHIEGANEIASEPPFLLIG